MVRVHVLWSRDACAEITGLIYFSVTHESLDRQRWCALTTCNDYLAKDGDGDGDGDQDQEEDEEFGLLFETFLSF